jgi:serine/threonine protein phosphatase 1
MNEKFAIVGDIHGDADRLASLVKAVEGRRLVFVGDYINRGKDSKCALDQLIELRERSPLTVFLRGNHEQGLLEYLRGAIPFYKFAALGGLSTIRNYLTHASYDVRNEFRAVFSREHLRFIEASVDYFEMPEVIISHCGIDPVNPYGRGHAEMVVTSHEQIFSEGFRPEKLVVCGHYVQTSGLPYISNNVICLDTGCGTAGGPLTALLLPERTFIQR